MKKTGPDAIFSLVQRKFISPHQLVDHRCPAWHPVRNYASIFAPKPESYSFFGLRPVSAPKSCSFCPLRFILCISLHWPQPLKQEHQEAQVRAELATLSSCSWTQMFSWEYKQQLPTTNVLLQLFISRGRRGAKVLKQVLFQHDCEFSCQEWGTTRTLRSDTKLGMNSDGLFWSDFGQGYKGRF